MAKRKDESDEQLVIEGTEETEMLARLSERVERAIALIQQLRKENEELSNQLEERTGECELLSKERDELQESLEQTKSQLAESAGHSESRLVEAEGELEKFRTERTEIRNRIEKILGSLASLEEEPA